MGEWTTIAAAPVKAPEHQANLSPSPREVRSVFGLQQAVGNQAMMHLLHSGAIQAKLRVSQPGDADEIEADRVAERIVSPGREPAIQRKCACESGGTPCAKCAEEEEEGSVHRSVAGTIPAVSRPSIQRLSTNESFTQEQAPPAAAQQPAGEKSRRALLLDDEARTPAPGQMKKSQFMQQLRTGVCATADAALAAVGRNSKSCPYIAQWLGFYATQSADRIERALHKYAPETTRAKSAQDYISILNDRVRQAVTVWARTGRVIGVPPGAPLLPGASHEGAAEAPGVAPAGPGKEPAGGSPSAPGHNILAKSEDSGAAATAADPQAVRERLGPGRPLDPSVRSRMEPAFGHDFSRVSLHTDSTAAQLSTELKARAFTIGESVAFAPAEYKPGTPVGDALIAHELAHVVQQGGAEAAAPSRGMEQDRGLEEDADDSAVHAVASIFNRGRASLGRIGARVAPALKSGLRLQRCGGHLKKCPSSRHWAVVGQPAGGGSLGCLCRWECVPGAPAKRVQVSSGPSISCRPEDYCEGPPPVDEVGEDYQQVGEGKLGYGAQMMQGDPLTGDKMCGCIPPGNLVDAETPPPIKTGADPTDFYAGPLPGGGKSGGEHEVRPDEMPGEIRPFEQGKGEPPSQPRIETHPAPETKAPDTTPAPQVKPSDVTPGATPQGTKSATNEPPAGGSTVQPPKTEQDPNQKGGAPQADPAQKSVPASTPAGGQPASVPPGTQPGSGGPPPSPGGPGVRVITVTGDTVVIDTNIAISLDKAAKDPSLSSLNDAQKANVAYAKGLGVAVTHETIGELGKKGGVGASVSGTKEIAIPPAEREAIKAEVSKVVGGAGDREVVTQTLLAEAEPGVTPILASADRGVINGLARLPGLPGGPPPIPVDRLGRYRTVAEYLKYERNTDRFSITIRGRSLTVRPVQPVRPADQLK